MKTGNLIIKIGHAARVPAAQAIVAGSALGTKPGMQADCKVVKNVCF
jgi:hypothetical protein